MHTNDFIVFKVYIWTGSRLTSQVARRANDCSVFKVYIWQKDRISSHFPRCTEDKTTLVSSRCTSGRKTGSLLTSQDARRTNVFSVFKAYLAKRRDLVSLHKMHGGPTTLVSSRYTAGKKTGSRLTSQDAWRTNVFSVFKVYIWQKDRISSHFPRCTEDQRL